MKKNYVIFFAIVWLILGINNASGQTGNDAVKALKKIEAKVTYGISYKDYIDGLSQAKVEVDLFLESIEAKKNAKLAESIKKAFVNYNMALRVWERGQENSNKSLKTRELTDKMWGVMFGNSPEERKIVNKHKQIADEANQKYNKEHLNPKVEYDYKLLLELRKSYQEIKELNFNDIILITDINRIIFQESTKELKKASNLLTQGVNGG